MVDISGKEPRIEHYHGVGAETVILQIAADGADRDRVIHNVVGQVLPALRTPS
jgi:hypothetical protein